MSFNSLLINICDIQSKTMSLSGYEKTLQWANIASSVPCRKGSSGNPNIKDGLSRLNTDESIFYFMPDVTIARGNRIVLDSENYDVVKVNKCQDSIGVHHIEAIARIVDHD